MRKYWEGWKNSAAIYWRGGGDRFRGMLGKHSNLHFKTGHSHFIEIFACLSFPVFLRNILRGIFLNTYITQAADDIIRRASADCCDFSFLSTAETSGKFCSTVHWEAFPYCTYFGTSILRCCVTNYLLAWVLGYLGTRELGNSGTPCGEYLGTACEGSSVPRALICTLSPSSTTLKA